ncbi:MAG: hypothetical protein K9L70_15575 [Thiohalocapsa sp.]|nr:hypothetical protein [Thiohalocapsa sp.]MCF7989909.1 hypothetical protein [Thiohalocapsa sp.]
MKQRARNVRYLSGLAVAAVLALAGCGSPGEDVRVTLCKDMVGVQLADTGPLSWTATETKTGGYEDAEVRLRYSGPDGAGAAVCYFKRDAVEDTAQHLADPMSAYSASPSKFLINGQTITGPALARIVKDAMTKQGRQLIDSAKQALQ